MGKTAYSALNKRGEEQKPGCLWNGFRKGKMTGIEN